MNTLEIKTFIQKYGNPYEILGVERTASSAEISKAYKLKALTMHPDKSCTKKDEESAEEYKSRYEIATEKFRSILTAKDSLLDKESRSVIDSVLSELDKEKFKSTLLSVYSVEKSLDLKGKKTNGFNFTQKSFNEVRNDFFIKGEPLHVELNNNVIKTNVGIEDLDEYIKLLNVNLRKEFGEVYFGQRQHNQMFLYKRTEVGENSFTGTALTPLAILDRSSGRTEFTVQMKNLTKQDIEALLIAVQSLNVKTPGANIECEFEGMEKYKSTIEEVAKKYNITPVFIEKENCSNRTSKNNL